MVNLKWGGACASGAFALALMLSLLLAQTSPLIALLRAVIFAAVFFGLGVAAKILINKFIPELLTSDARGGGDIATSLFSTDTAGSRVNITVDDSNAALPEQEGGAPDGGDVGDFNELFAKRDIDQTSATGYTEGGEADEFSSATEGFAPEEGFASTAGFAPAGEFASTGEFSSAFNDAEFNEEDESGGLSMDFSAFVPGSDNTPGQTESEDESGSDSGLDSFSFFSEAAAPAATSAREPEASERKASGNKPMKLEGDFNAKEIAAGLRTVLEKDKK